MLNGYYIYQNIIYLTINMASTRNNNTCGDYKQQQAAFNRNLDEMLYKYGSGGTAYNPGLPCGGSAPPSLMKGDALSDNAVEIESALLGISSTNLVEQREPVYPKLLPLKPVEFFKRPSLIMPNDLVVPTNQRADFLSR